MEPAPGHLQVQNDGETSEQHGQLAEPETSAPFMDRRGSSLRIDAAPFVPFQVCGLQLSIPHSGAHKSAVLRRVISAELSGIVLITATICVACRHSWTPACLSSIRPAAMCIGLWTQVSAAQEAARGFWRCPQACVNSSQTSANRSPSSLYLKVLPGDSTPRACACAVPFSPSQGICTPSPSHANAALQYWQSQYAHIFW